MTSLGGIDVGAVVDVEDDVGNSVIDFEIVLVEGGGGGAIMLSTNAGGDDSSMAKSSPASMCI